MLSDGPVIARIAAEVREAFAARAERLPEPGAGLLPGLAVGDTRAVGEELNTAMVASGLSHLTAVSGRNIITSHASPTSSARVWKSPAIWVKSQDPESSRPAPVSTAHAVTMTNMDGHMNGLTDLEIAAVREAARISVEDAPPVTAKTAQFVGGLLKTGPRADGTTRESTAA